MGRLFNLVRAAADDQGDKAAFVEIADDGTRRLITYRELLGRIRSGAVFLSSHGVIPGDRVLLCAENSLEWLVLFFSINAVGAIAVPLDYTLTSDELAKVSDGCRPKLSFFSKKQAFRLFGFMLPDDVLEIELIGNIALVPDIEINESPPVAAYIYTSGTTGNPKAVLLTENNYMANLESIDALRLCRPDDVFLSVLPFYHSFPFMVTVLLPVYQGATCIILDSLKPSVILNTLTSSSITVLPAVPIFFKNIAEGIRRKIDENLLSRLVFPLLVAVTAYSRKYLRLNTGRIFFSTVHRKFGKAMRVLVCGGARLDSSVFRMFYGMGFTLLEGYGLTEAAPVVSFNLPGAEKVSSVGFPLPGVEVKICAAGGSEGEILVKGGNVTPGYLNSPDETNRTLNDGWLRTGDIGYLDVDGYLYITGRKKEVIIRPSGKNVYPEDVESEFTRSGQIKECILSATGRNRDGALALVVHIPAEKDNDELRELLRNHIRQISIALPEHRRPEKIIFTEREFPRTSLGKPRRHIIEGWLDEIDTTDLVHRGYSDERVRVAVAAVFSELGVSGIDISERLFLDADLGFDSLRKVELLVKLEEKTGVTFPEGFLADAVTVGDLIERLKRFTSEKLQVRADRKGFRELLLSPLSADDERSLHARSSVSGVLAEWLLYGIMRSARALLFDIRVDRAFDTLTSPCILAPNHTSFLDGFLISAIVPWHIKKKLYFIGLSEFFNRFPLRFLRQPGGVLAFDALSEPVRLLKTGIHALRAGYSVCIFPEGERSYDGNLQQFQKGVAVMADLAGVPVYPIRIEGAYETWPRFKKYPRLFSRISISIGAPVSYSSIEGGDAEVFLGELRRRIEELGSGGKQ